jgi:mono/diheme cytochrome c family protein
VLTGLAATLAFAVAPCITHSAEPHAGKPGTGVKQADRKQIDRGRYMLIVGSCNDCHTAGFAPSDGKVPEKDWLMGSGPLGYRGPWGTTYAPNLRVTAGRMTEDQWVKFSKELKSRPPMPWFNLNQWAESDLRALYQYIKHLGPEGEPAQAYLPPDKIPKPPYVQWPAPPK